MLTRKFLILVGCFSLGYFFSSCEQKEKWIPIVENGKLLNAKSTGEAWTAEEDFLTYSGRFNELCAKFKLGNGDFHIRTRLSIEKIDATATLFVIGKNHFGFDSKQDGEDTDSQNRFFTYSPSTGKVIRYGKAVDYFQADVPFDFEVKGVGNEIITSINDKEVLTISKDSLWFPFVGGIGFRPWLNRIKIYDWEIAGDWGEFPEMDYLFSGGELGYFCFRNPTMIKVGAVLLAFAQGRKKDCHDLGDRDLLVKRSTDNGSSWSDAVVLLDGGKNAFTGPVPMVVSSSGRIILLATEIQINYNGKNPEKLGELGRKIFKIHSDDSGLSWSEPMDLSDQLIPPHWTSIASGPGSGIELQHAVHADRLVAPFYHRDTSGELFSHVIYSDDGGHQWTIGGIAPNEKVTECKVAELDNGDLILTMRPDYSTPPYRQTAISRDGGVSWQNPQMDSLTRDNHCMASLLSVENGKKLIFSNPASPYGLYGMTVKSTRNSGQSWENEKLIHPGPSMYSDLILLPDNRIGLFFEHGFIYPNEGLLFISLDL